MAKSRKARVDSQPAGSRGEAERFDPTQDGPDLAYEHAHRYAVAASVVTGLRVLDLASGAGYGSALLAKNAASLLCLDRDRSTLGAGNPSCCADAQALPIADGSFDAVVCFEAIEHVPDPVALLDEVQRVLCGPALFIASTPDRRLYTDRAGHRNPHHSSEMTRAQFLDLLVKRFRHVQLFGQSLWAGSWLSRLEENERCFGTGPRSPLALPDPLAVASDERVTASWADPRETGFPVPVYLVAACANSEAGARLLGERMSAESILHDPGQWLIGRYERSLEESRRQRAEVEAARRSIGKLEKELGRARAASADQEQQIARARERVDSLVADFEQRIARRERTIAELESQIENARANAVDFEGQIAQGHRTIAELESQIENATANAADFERQIAQSRSTVAELETQIEDARTGAADFERQIAQSRSTVAELETQIEDARTGAADLEQQIAQSRSTVAELETQIEDARTGAADFEAQIESARASARAHEQEIEQTRREISERAEQLAAAREVSSRLEAELGDQQRLAAERAARVGELEAQLSRRFHRAAAKLTNLLDTLRGRRS
jgi:SAM-dependent methyltransferase